MIFVIRCGEDFYSESIACDLLNEGFDTIGPGIYVYSDTDKETLKIAKEEAFEIIIKYDSSEKNATYWIIESEDYNVIYRSLLKNKE